MYVHKYIYMHEYINIYIYVHPGPYTYTLDGSSGGPKYQNHWALDMDVTEYADMKIGKRNWFSTSSSARNHFPSHRATTSCNGSLESALGEEKEINGLRKDVSPSSRNLYPNVVTFSFFRPLILKTNRRLDTPIAMAHQTPRWSHRSVFRPISNAGHKPVIIGRIE
jgi:hypothetical protein